MWNLRGRFDPVIGLKLSSSIDNTVQAPDPCPADPIERQKFLAAHALARLLAGAAPGKAGRPEFVAVIDVDAPVLPDADGPTVDWPIPVEVPGRVLAEPLDRRSASAGNSGAKEDGVVDFEVGAPDQLR